MVIMIMIIITGVDPKVMSAVAGGQGFQGYILS